MKESTVASLDPRTKLLSFFLLLAALLLTDGPGEMLAGAFLLAGLVLWSGIPARRAMGSLLRFWQFFLFVFLLNAFFFSKEAPLLRFWVFTLTEAGIRQGGKVVIHVAFVLVLGAVLTETTRPVELTRGITRLLSPLRFLCLPVEEIALTVSLALRFIPTLEREAETLRLAETARGADFQSKNPLLRVKSYASLLLPIFLVSFKRADDLSVAMEARGYRGAENRTPPPPMPYPPRELWIVGGSLALAVAAGLF